MKLLISLLAVAVLASSALAGPITSVTLDSYSGRLMSSYDGPLSIDGDAGTAWYSEMSNDVNTMPYAVYAFDATYKVGDVSITMSDGNFRKLETARMSVSTDGVKFAYVGSFQVDTANGVVTTFDLGGVDAQYVKLEGERAFYSNWNTTEPATDVTTPGAAPDGKYAISFAEIAFSEVPEPATLGLLTLGGLVALRRRRA